MGCSLSRARRSRHPGAPPSRPREAARQSAASKTTQSTANMDAPNNATQSEDGRTSILMYGRSHEDPLRCNPVSSVPLGGDGDGEKDIEPPPVRQRPQRNANVSWEKRSGLVLNLADETDSFWGGSTRRGTEVEEDKQDKVEELSRSTAVQTDETLHASEPLEVDTNT